MSGRLPESPTTLTAVTPSATTYTQLIDWLTLMASIGSVDRRTYLWSIV